VTLWGEVYEGDTVLIGQGRREWLLLQVVGDLGEVVRKPLAVGGWAYRRLVDVRSLRLAP
jgi:hypothetical protein